MKKILIILLLFSVTLYAKSGIKFNTLEHDFGSISQDSIVTARFTFRNTGNSVLVIERVRTSCGCTSVFLSSQKLNPGEQGTLEIAFDSMGYSGSVTRSITVYTNDPSNKEVRLKIRANVLEADDK